MKKLFIPAILALLASCSQIEKDAPVLPEEEITPVGYKVLTITAQKADDTKTSYAGDKTFSWNVGDKISVVCNDGTQNLWETFTVEEAAASSTFKATVADNINLGALDGSKVALYPASNSHVFTSAASGGISFHIPAERDFLASSGGHQESAIPMFAWGTDDDTYAFSNLTGAAKFTFTGISSSRAKMTFTAPSAKLNGTYSLSFDTINKSNASNVHWDASSTENESEKSVVYYADVKDHTATFYLPYAEGSIVGTSTLKLEDPTTETVFYNNTQVGKIDVHKNQIAVLPELNLSFHSAYGIDWDNVSEEYNYSVDAYTWLKSLRATADANYIYLYIQADPSLKNLNHHYDCRFHFYIEDNAGSVNPYWKEYDDVEDDYVYYKYREIDDSQAKWGVKDGSISFITNGSDNYSSNLLMDLENWHYEIRINRSVDWAFSSAGTIKIGVILDDAYKQDAIEGHSNSETHYGVIPTVEGVMYELELP